MKLHSIYLFAAVLHLFFALPTEALIVLGGDEGHTSAPADDPGWDNVGYVRYQWGVNRASGVYIGDGWVLTAYHVLWFDAPTGIVFNVDSDKAYPIDVSSYIRLETNSFTRMADSPYWENYDEVSADMAAADAKILWYSIHSSLAPSGADLAMFRLKDGHYPDIEPVHISEIWSNWLSFYLSYLDDEVTAIATGRPRLEELSYWKTNETDDLVVWVEGTDGPLTNAPYSGYQDCPSTAEYGYPDPWYQPICRWGKNKIYAYPSPITRPTFGTTICLPTVFNNYDDDGGNSDTFQMAGLDSGGGVFYKGSGKWELLGLLTAKQLPNGIISTDLTAHPFGSYSWICDLSYYREQIMRVTEWPDISVQLLDATNIWAGVGQPVSFSILTTNTTTNAVPSAFTNTLILTHNGQTNDIIQIRIPALAGGESHTYPYSFTPDSPGAWKFSTLADSENQVYEILEHTDDSNDQGFKQNNEIFKTFYAGPDLRIIQTSPALTNAVAGSQFPVQVISTNQGVDTASATFEISYYLNTNYLFATTLNESELAAIKQEPFITVSGLPGNSVLTNVLTVTAPTNIGRYYLRARVDSSTNVAEAIESNNWGPLGEIRVGPDLVIAGSSTAESAIEPGEPVSIEVTVKNQGTASANSSHLGLYVINSITWEGDKEPWASVMTEPLPAGQQATSTITFTVPTNNGTYYLFASADDDDEIFNVPTNGLVIESVEDNNESYLSTLYVEDIYTVVTNNGTITITDYHGSGGNVEIPRTINGLPVTEIGNSAFAYSTNLTSITMPDTVTTIADQAFQSCTSLTNVVLSTNLTTLGYGPPGAGAFRECTSLTRITIPASVTSISPWAFGLCTSLRSVKLQNNVIGYGMFAGCTSLSAITVPGSVTGVGDQAFAGCTDLTKVHFLGNAPVPGGTNIFNNVSSVILYRSMGNSGWGETWGGLPVKLLPYHFAITGEGLSITGYSGSGGDVIIPSIIADLPVINISANAFASCTNIVSITIPATVTSIGDQAFADCTGLRNIYFLGNAPIAGTNPFSNTPGRVYYLPGAAGWPMAPDTWAGRPTAAWNPVIEIGDTPTGPFQFEFTWSSGMVVVVEASTNLSAVSWVPVETNTLDNGPALFSDPQSTNHPARFYRIRTEL